MPGSQAEPPCSRAVCHGVHPAFPSRTFQRHLSSLLAGVYVPSLDSPDPFWMLIARDTMCAPAVASGVGARVPGLQPVAPGQSAAHQSVEPGGSDKAANVPSRVRSCPLLSQPPHRWAVEYSMPAPLSFFCEDDCAGKGKERREISPQPPLTLARRLPVQ